jgi:hypothetical protein
LHAPTWTAGPCDAGAAASAGAPVTADPATSRSPVFTTCCGCGEPHAATPVDTATVTILIAREEMRRMLAHLGFTLGFPRSM